MGQRNDKETLKKLRETRKAAIARARSNLQANTQVVKAIRDQIEAAPRTVPEIAEALSMDTDKVLLYIAAMKKYGEVVEGTKQGDYFTYISGGTR